MIRFSNLVYTDRELVKALLNHIAVSSVLVFKPLLYFSGLYPVAFIGFVNLTGVGAYLES